MRSNPPLLGEQFPDAPDDHKTTPMLPALAVTGCLEVFTTTYGRLRNGFYGLGPVVLTLLFLALLRDPRAEGLTRVSPADLGRLLGLDRAPEVKTLRRGAR